MQLYFLLGKGDQAFVTTPQIAPECELNLEESSFPQHRDLSRKGLICEPSAVTTSDSWGNQYLPSPERKSEQYIIVSTVAILFTLLIY